MSPRMTKEESPPAVTTPRKILSESRGSVVIVLGAGTGRLWPETSVVATCESWPERRNLAWLLSE